MHALAVGLHKNFFYATRLNDGITAGGFCRRFRHAFCHNFGDDYALGCGRARHGGKSCDRCGFLAGRTIVATQFVHQTQPCFFRQFVEEPHAVAGEHGVDDLAHFVRRACVQKDVLMEIRKMPQNASGQLYRQQPKKSLLLLVWQSGNQVSRNAGGKAFERRYGFRPARFCQQITELFCFQRTHSGFPRIRYRSPDSLWLPSRKD